MSDEQGTERGRQSAPITRDEAAEGEYETHLGRSQRVWNRWSEWYSLSESDFEPVRSRTIQQLDLDVGDRVIDIGCGPGVNFEPIVKAIGPSGDLHAIDLSPAMVEKARARIEDNGWDNVTVFQADATTADVDGPYDAAVATLSLSVMPDIPAVMDNISGSIKSDGEFGVVDLRLIPTGPARLVNPLLKRFLQWYANWNPNGDVLHELNRSFEVVDRREVMLHGICYAVIARNPGSPSTPHNTD